jgi:DNA-binding NarL/FixJ family response regulator
MPSDRIEHILIVEDDVTTQNWLATELLAMPGVHVNCCSSVAEACQWLTLNTPDIVLIDLGLPDGSGTDVIRYATSRHPGCEALVISVFGDESHVVSAIEAGASGYLLKDSSIDQLGDHLQHLRQGGSPLSPQIARTLIRRQQTPSNPLASESSTIENQDHNVPSALTPREIEVLTLIAKGFSYQEAAQLLEVSANTVRTYIKRIYQKLSVNSRSEAVFEFNQWQEAQGLPPLR